jgi:molecular chaperone GrpE (heat shock protein)
MPPNSVVVTIQKGYALNGRVLRAARVIVSRALDA